MFPQDDVGEDHDDDRGTEDDGGRITDRKASKADEDVTVRQPIRPETV